MNMPIGVFLSDLSGRYGDKGACIVLADGADASTVLKQLTGAFIVVNDTSQIITPDISVGYIMPDSDLMKAIEKTRPRKKRPTIDEELDMAYEKNNTDEAGFEPETKEGF